MIYDLGHLYPEATESTTKLKKFAAVGIIIKVGRYFLYNRLCHIIHIYHFFFTRGMINPKYIRVLYVMSLEDEISIFPPS